MSYNESLRSNSNYPAMSQHQWDSAPFNEPVIQDEEFEVTCCQSLSKTVTVTTSNYTPVYDEETRTSYPDTSDTNWEDEYHDNDYHTPEQLITLFGKYLSDMLYNTGKVNKSPSYLKRIMKECDDWQADETEFIEE